MIHANSLKRPQEGDEDSSYSSDPKRPVPKKPKLQTDRQHLRLESNSTSPIIMQNYLYKELEKKLVGEEDNKIILPSDVKAIWAPRSVHSFYTNQSWYNTAWDKDCTLGAYLQIMSILIWISYPADMWKDFKDDFIVPKRNDKCLPFDLRVLQDLLGSRNGALARAFHDVQPIFCPLVIKERNEPITLQKRQRLPWLEEPKEIGRGAGGVVQKYKIAAGHLIYSNWGRNTEPKAVALKTVSNSMAHDQEFRNLSELRGCLSVHKNILVNIATFITGSSGGMSHSPYHLLYELAAYDLHEFLKTPRPEHRGRRRDSASPGRNRSIHIQPADLIEASSHLADAMYYIHNRLYNREGRIALAHNDIKPENILVVYPDSTDPKDCFPAGVWKLADFGLSRIKEPRKSDMELLGSEDALQPPIVTEITHRLQFQRSESVSRTLPKRYPGSYTAPEIDQNSNHPEKLDGRKADVWSFGIVLSEVVAYAVKMDDSLVKELQDTAGTRFYDKKKEIIKPCIREFFDGLPKHAPQWAIKAGSHAWIESCTGLVKQILDINSTERPKAGEVRDTLRNIRRDAGKQNRSWTDDGYEKSGSPEPVSHTYVHDHSQGGSGTTSGPEWAPQIMVSSPRSPRASEPDTIEQ